MRQAAETKAPGTKSGTQSLGRLHVIINVVGGRAGPFDPVELAQRALDGGAPVLQLRAKTMTDRDIFDLATRLASLCEDGGASLIVDDRVDVALAAGADGVHVGAEDLPVAAARDLLGPGPILGATCRHADAARAAELDRASYIGAGPCYATSTKSGLPDPIGLATLRQITEAVSLPVIAIAGVTASRVPELLEAGAYGVAVVGAVADATDPTRATRELVDIIERHA